MKKTMNVKALSKRSRIRAASQVLATITPSRSTFPRQLAFYVGIILFLCLGGIRVFSQDSTNVTVVQQLKLPGIFCDHIVLQRDKPIRIWGWATVGEKVTVEFSGQTKDAKADAQGKWQLHLAPLPASAEGKTLVVRSRGAEIKVADVAVGEVWFCSGQSNMELSLGRFIAEEQKEAENPQLRFFTYSRQENAKPQDDINNGRWLVVGPQTVGRVYATAYYFGKMVQKELGVPVAFIQGAIGGTPIEAWMARETFGSDSELEQIAETKLKLSSEGEIKNKTYLEQGGDPKKLPWPLWRVYATPARLYNGMVHPFTPFTIRGFLWYQAEDNLGNPQAYGKLFPAHIKGWRTAWGRGNLPFYYCQLPGVVVKGGPTPEGNVALMRLIQAQAQALPKTGMAVIYDTGEADNNHPENKRPHGERLARLALAKDYGKAIMYSGPIYAASKMEGNHIRVRFSSVGLGLEAKEIPMEYRPSTRKPEIKPVTRTNPGSQLEGFQVQNEKGEWIWSDARIDGSDVVVEIKEVLKVKAIRYACIDFGFFNLFNKEGLPAAPFEALVK
jgi:sialate O-acetylesterase